jgi:hypothetical protein
MIRMQRTCLPIVIGMAGGYSRIKSVKTSQIRVISVLLKFYDNTMKLNLVSGHRP